MSVALNAQDRVEVHGPPRTALEGAIQLLHTNPISKLYFWSHRCSSCFITHLLPGSKYAVVVGRDHLESVLWLTLDHHDLLGGIVAGYNLVSLAVRVRQDGISVKNSLTIAAQWTWAPVPDWSRT